MEPAVRSPILFTGFLALGCGPPCDLAVLEGAITMNGHVQADVLVEATHEDYGTQSTTTDDWGTWSLELEPGTWEVVTDHVCWDMDRGGEGELVELDCEGLVLDLEISYCLQ
jgi:hypothetical protein